MTQYNFTPVELLRDGRGVYGIGVSELFDYEALAWSCGIEPESCTFERPPRALILRPDYFMNAKPDVGDATLCARGYAVLQKIVGGFRRGPFMHSGEERLRQFIHHEALRRAGLPWPPPQDDGVRWWAGDEKQQARNRGIYHGLRATRTAPRPGWLSSAAHAMPSHRRRSPWRYNDGCACKSHCLALIPAWGARHDE
jgi:hypothetical protein